MRTQTTRPGSTAPRAALDEQTSVRPNEDVVASVPVRGLAVPLQRKVIVGGVNDPAEAEADRVAHSVVAVLRRTSSPHTDGADCSHCAGAPIRRASITTLRRHGATQDHDHEPTVGLAGGEVDPATESKLNASAGQGDALPEELQRSIGAALGADLSGIRVHSGADSAGLNRGMSALAFTRGRDIYFRDGLPDVNRDAGLHLLAHELAHTVQQGSAPRAAAGFAGAVGVQRFTGRDVIHRHAAFEHYLLGQLQPKELASIPEVRKVRDNEEQKKNAKKKAGSKKTLTKQKLADQGLEEGDVTLAKRKQVRHLIDQEMERLLEFRKDPEALSDRAGEKGQVSRRQTDLNWNVPIVVLNCVGGDVVVSYSEMNTMPDLFGNPEAIERTPKDKVLALLQGVRQQLYIELSNLRQELFGFANNELHNSVTTDGDFEGAQGPRAQAVNEKAYEIRTEKQVNAATTRKGEESEQYFAALERNACHFAPESWAQWRGYHVKAVALAQASYAKREEANDPNNAGTAAALNAQADDLSNKAMIQNSFGEHYLQDSFAAGHLIDKTKIMQWFTIWLDENGMEMGHGPAAQGQWAMAVHAAKQPLKSNPQALHDKGRRGELATVKDAADEVGLQNTPEIELLMRWRAAFKQDHDMRTVTPPQLAKQLGLPRKDVVRDVRLLVRKKLVTPDPEIPGLYQIDMNQTQSVYSGASGIGQAYKATKGTAPGAMAQADVDDAASEFNLAAYNAMLSNAYIGSATKFFHDKFCKEGLQVVSGTNVDLGRIYGDANMMNAGGQKGLEYSAETSRQSRSSVFSILAGERNVEFYPTAAIEARFPKTIKIDGGAAMSVEDFNKDLRRQGEAKLFKEAKTIGALVVYKAMNGISDKGALDVAKLAHGGPF